MNEKLSRSTLIGIELEGKPTFLFIVISRNFHIIIPFLSVLLCILNRADCRMNGPIFVAARGTSNIFNFSTDNQLALNLFMLGCIVYKCGMRTCKQG